MRCLVLIAVSITGIVARPETYREKEDFQYSRSSSDDGSKSGYYGAQRGNMGGNYERAHNMDSLAQHQMSGLVHQVEGEVGDTSNTNAGSVYTAANSRGMYGSGHYDLSNLEGRNFQEGTSHGGSHSQGALTNSAYRNHASGSNSYGNSNSYSHSSKHSSSARYEHEKREEIQSSNLRSGDSAYQQEHGAYGGSSNQEYSWSPYQNRLVSTRPMRILVRPGTKVTVPIATQTYNADHSASSYDASKYNQNTAKSDAEIIVDNDLETSHRQVPTSKHYESSYSYRKEWEKHHSSPGAVPLGVDIDSSIPKTSELYDDSQHTQAYNNQHQYASNAADTQSHQSYGYNSRTNLASSSQSKHESNYGVQQERLSSDLNALALNTQLSNLNQDYANQQATVNSKPKSYQSSYSYHKSWERQGDPYVIVPVPDVQNGQASQRLTTASNSHNGYSSHQYGLNRKQSHQSYTNSNGLMDCDCDEEGHVRVARSYNTDQEVQQQQEDLSQQSQNGWDGQQIQWGKIEDLGQQTQNQFDKIEDLEQQTQNQWGKMEDLGQQTQTHFDKIEDFGQQSQHQWDKIKDLEQQTQNHFNKIEDLGQRPQNQWGKIEDLGQQTQNSFDKTENFGQQSQNGWAKFEDLGHKTEDIGQQSQNQWDKIEDLGQQTQTQFDKIEDLGQHSLNQWKEYNQFDQQSQSNFGQEQATWNKLQKSNEDKYTDEINKDQSYSNTFTDDVTHNTDKQTKRGHKEQIGEQEDYFYSHLPQDFHTHHIDESLPQHSSSVNSLWNKLNRLSGEPQFNNNHNTNEYTSIIEAEHQFNPSQESTTTENVIVTDKTEAQPKPLLGRGDIPDSTVVNPKNIGRGDIPDTPQGLEFLKYSSTTEIMSVVSTPASSSNKRNRTEFKTQNDTFYEKLNDQIEHSSNSYNVNHQSQSVQALEQKDRQHNFFENFDAKQESKNVSGQSTNHNQTLKSTDYYNKQHFEQGLVDLNKFNKNNDQQNVNHYGDFYKQSENLDQQNMQQGIRNIMKPVEIVDQQNLDQNLVDFNKWNVNFDEHSIKHHSVAFDQQNQQNVQQEIENFEKPVEIADQENLNQNLVEFDKWNDNLDQQNKKNHTQSFDQQNQQNIEQEVQSFDNPSDSFGQEHLVDLSQNANQQSMSQQSENFHKHSEDINPQNMVQELQSFNKLHDSFDQQTLNQNFHQQNMNHHSNLQNEDLHQQNIEQELQNFEKPSKSFDQQNQNLEDFHHQSHHFEGFDQQNLNLEQQNLGQELQNFDKPVEIFEEQNLNQDLDDFSHFSKKFDQQVTNQDSQYFSKPSYGFDKQQNLNLINFEGLNQTPNQHNLQHQSHNQQFDYGTGRENYDQQTMHKIFRSPALESEIVQKQAAESKLEHSDIQQNNNKLLSTQQTEHYKVSQSTSPPETEKTGFWASVGKKFTSAKDKVSSWFTKKSD